MSKDDDPKKLGSVDVGLALPGGGGAHLKVDASEGLVRFVKPELYRAQVAFDTLIRGIHLKQDRGDDLSPIEQQVLTVSALPILSGKLDNVSAVIGYAQALDPEFGKYVNGKVPLSEPPEALLPGENEEELDIEVTVDEQEKQYWWDRFWVDAEGVTADYVRKVLGQIAARKARDPKSVSLRTLDVLRCLEPTAIAIFDRFSLFVWSDKAAPSVTRFQDEYDRNGLGFGELNELEEAGLISIGSFEHLFGSAEIAGHEFTCLETADHPAKIPIVLLTRPGRELFKLLTPKPRERQVLAVGRYIQRHVHGGSVLWKKPDGGQYLPLPPDPEKTEDGGDDFVVFESTFDHETEHKPE